MDSRTNYQVTYLTDEFVLRVPLKTSCRSSEAQILPSVNRSEYASYFEKIFSSLLLISSV